VDPGWPAGAGREQDDVDAAIGTALDLARERDARSARVSSRDRRGWNQGGWTIGAGEAQAIADLEGPASIRHVLLTGSAAGSSGRGSSTRLRRRARHRCWRSTSCTVLFVGQRLPHRPINTPRVPPGAPPADIADEVAAQRAAHEERRRRYLAARALLRRFR
jgi:hypothetical protein